MKIDLVNRFDTPMHEELRQFLHAMPASRGACGEHDPRWLRVLEQAMHHQPLALIARGDNIGGSVRGYLPLSLVSSRLFGRFLVSLPYLNRAGLVTDDDATAAAMLERAVALADEHDVQYIELRHESYIASHDAITHEKRDKLSMLLDLPCDAEALWTGLDAKVRNQVRKGEKHGLAIRFGGVELLDAFYDIFAVNMRDLGTPVYSRRLFEAICMQFPDDAELAVVTSDGVPAAGALLVHDALRGSTQVPSASSLRAFNASCANMWMYHQLLLRAIERGQRAFDFGRSSEGSGTHRFKKQWGAQARPSVWQYHLRRGELDAVRPEHPRYQRRIRTWQKLPVWVTRMIGPSIVRGIP